MRFRPALLLILAASLPLGCSLSDHGALELPAGWETDEMGRWWEVGVDTSEVFRDLETLQAMGIAMSPVVYDATQPISSQARVSQDRLVWYVKQSLLPLFRNRPEVVDSLFEVYVAPRIVRGGPSDDPGGDVAKYKREGYRAIYRHFREPRTLLQVGTDIPVEIPDSLSVQAAGRAVSFQVFISDDGRPAAVELLSGVHPVLDRIALKATLQMRWQPAYLLQKNKSVPVESWARFRIRFPG